MAFPRGGSFTTDWLRTRIAELLTHVRALANTDREAGRLPAADLKEELIDAIEEYQRLTENAIAAHRQSIAILEKQCRSSATPTAP